MNASPELLGGQFGEPALDEVEPGGAGPDFGLRCVLDGVEQVIGAAKA